MSPRNKTTPITSTNGPVPTITKKKVGLKNPPEEEKKDLEPVYEEDEGKVDSYYAPSSPCYDPEHKDHDEEGSWTCSFFVAEFPTVKDTKEYLREQVLHFLEDDLWRVKHSNFGSYYLDVKLLGDTGVFRRIAADFTKTDCPEEKFVEAAKGAFSDFEPKIQENNEEIKARKAQCRVCHRYHCVKDVCLNSAEKRKYNIDEKKEAEEQRQEERERNKRFVYIF